MSESNLKIYYDALDRLINGKPHVLEKGTKITNDAVSLEAGRKKGSIKKSRPVFAALLVAIDAAAANQSKPKVDDADRIKRIKGKADDLQEQLDAALAREMSLVYELLEVRKKLSKLTGENVFPIRRRAKENSI